MAVIGWGQPKIYISPLDTQGNPTKWTLVPTPAEGTTELATEKGDKQEAKLEGGANEDVRYSKNTYSLSFTLRMSKGRSKLIEDEDGIISANYAVALIPEDEEVNGIMIDKAQVSVEDTWSAEEGGQWTYTFDALQPAKGTQVKYGVIEVTGSGESLSVGFKEGE